MGNDIMKKKKMGVDIEDVLSLHWRGMHIIYFEPYTYNKLRNIKLESKWIDLDRENNNHKNDTKNGIKCNGLSKQRKNLKNCKKTIISR